jgi:hypothetical protein
MHTFASAALSMLAAIKGLATAVSEEVAMFEAVLANGKQSHRKMVNGNWNEHISPSHCHWKSWKMHFLRQQLGAPRWDSPGESSAKSR